MENAERLVSQGYYSVRNGSSRPRSFLRSLIECPAFPIIAEVKLSSPSGGSSRHSPRSLANKYLNGGAACLSVLTEPRFFKGNLEHLRSVASLGLPTLMKDIIISKEQVDAAASLGASSILLIQSALDLNRARAKRDILIDYAHLQRLEVLLEVTNERELEEASRSSADIIGINQRNISDLTLDGTKGLHLLSLCEKKMRPVVVMSGLEKKAEVERLRDAGADAVLIGTYLSQAERPEDALRSLLVPR